MISAFFSKMFFHQLWFMQDNVLKIYTHAFNLLNEKKSIPAGDQPNFWRVKMEKPPELGPLMCVCVCVLTQRTVDI